MYRISSLLILFFGIMSFGAIAQNKADSIPDPLFNDMAPILDVGKRGEKSISKKSSTSKKPEKTRNTYAGLPIKKYFKKYEDERGRNITETFYVLKEYKKPISFVKVYYYLDIAKRKIESSAKIPPEEEAMILHGPYERKLNGKLIERGMYFLSCKHDLWERFNKEGILVEKERLNKGFPFETKYVYYDANQTRLKEVIPIKGGYRDGYYCRYYPDGVLAEEGYYMDGEKVGRWTEFYDKKSIANRKREMQFQEKPFDTSFKPYIYREWSESGKLIIDNTKK